LLKTPRGDQGSARIPAKSKQLRGAGRRTVLHAISLGLVLFSTWLLLSGFFEPLLLTFGVVSCAIVLAVVHRMDVVDHEGHPVHLGWRILPYWFWLTVEIVKANIAVAKLIVDPKMPIGPVMIQVPTSQHGELGQVIFANSITLTPGTVSIRVSGRQILVHSITREMADDLLSGEMDRRVTRMEGGPPPKALDRRGRTGGTA
jgi:multicomponent Na+:H+ antiporter subunit E